MSDITEPETKRLGDGSSVDKSSLVREDVGATSAEHESRQEYLQGLRLRLITACICMVMFLSNLEIPVVTTALVGISDDLGEFKKASWVSTSYLLGYAGFIIIFAKMSDVFGRKPMLLLTTIMFAIFSGACGAAQSMDQLIIFRAFQGIGASGDFALCSVMVLDLVPSHKYADYSSNISIVYAISLCVGPIIGGAIAQKSTWRWIFLLNVPAAAVTAVVIALSVPAGFPHHHRPRNERPNSKGLFSVASLRRLDFVGTASLLISTVLLVAALEESGVLFPWRSAYSITLLIIAGLSWILFLFWERYITLKAKTQEPVFPWRFAQSRVFMGNLLCSIFLGAPWICAMFQLPQRLQVVNSLTPIQAGVHFIPFTLAAPIGSVITGILAKGAKIPPLYMVLFAGVLQVIGFSLLSTLPVSQAVTPAQYGYQVIAGFGCGTNISLLVLLTPFCVQERDKSVAMGSVAQYRILGSAIGLAIVTPAFNALVRRELGDLLSSGQVDDLLQSPAMVSNFSGELQDTIRATFGNGYNLQLKILAGLAAGQIPAGLLMWQKKQIVT